MLTLHILVAISGLIISTLLYLRPSKFKYNLSSGLLASTLISGTVLVAFNPVHIVKTCIMGLAYTSFVVAMLYLSSKKLATYKVRPK